ncbi:MAG: 23S rRNA (pseudouridine(1915)-N(3))-methyltransferase RlmH [Chelatococcus sp.]|jgi:23S rRNA (pseudouridine1915-N3)-methyltransferase|uniref:23S rRNA (pseudouridine(1915)-N(3))-methyltransferase RlmH n=1 Tax=unclassified Chelatococcus TaxID=2638111 RepID=UPI001BCE6283|nr:MULTISPECIES: 23S rRNA (pseudouridine(1915)-N(3))-methyltransferase RlmH [unclassified Chelatococcus]CAH1653397.1 Ribosomal RNA large subunit methyltransferase H [Hyphomicrobiales bacterium]MBS7740113.1 23S rRNA (pseudouridine(1915)-N(3))-methyltransferase RlmH [Chelatococcus sp. HY11]MBX3538634.1 23S rRNA (pseudouridine(1915)-N(3))-methyltransferase RlmH [Chelatococcus sp.]MBX3545058.1 23S rRNA (pseudouridine(1915)-N(3))-methyltransferase RlmH [Chelatococcus sp.]MCO5078587.1 23S rRNA (pseu
MRLTVVAVGRLKAGPERILVERYLERSTPLARTLGFGAVDVVELPESRAKRAGERKTEEAAAIVARCGNGVVLAFDETGASMPSPAFAKRCADWRDAGVDSINFVIGGADGLDERVRAHAAGIMAFGAATLPHQLVRILVAEQIYRAMTILTGHPYHRV